MALVVLVATAGWPAMAGAQDDAPAVQPVRLVSPSGDALEEGASATPFTLDLPEGAACQGDSRDEDYRVNSYMVPGTVDPLDIEFNGLGPQPQALGDHATFRHPLYDVDTAFFVSVQTADAENIGDPGTILDIPAFDLDVFFPGEVPAGRYRLGIACTLRNAVTRAWDAQIDVTTDPADAPAQIHWRTVGFEPDEGSGSSVPVIAGVLLAIGAVAIAITRSRRRPARTTPQRRTS